MNDSKEQSNALAKAAEAYEKHPVIRALAQALSPIPGVSIIDAGFQATATRLREERDRAFFEELGRQGTITEEHLKNKDFVHACISTLTAARRTQREEKIKMFARLLANYAKGDMNSTADACEQQLAILEELTYLEIQVLLLIDFYEQTAYPNGPHPPRSITYNGSFWVELLDNIEDKMRVPFPQIFGLIERLRRTGLFEKIPSSSAHAFEHRGCWLTDEAGRLTPNFDTLKQWIGDNTIEPLGCAS